MFASKEDSLNQWSAIDYLEHLDRAEKHLVYVYDSRYLFSIAPINSGTIIFPVVDTRIILAPQTMTEFKYLMKKERYAQICVIPIRTWSLMMVGIGIYIENR